MQNNYQTLVKYYDVLLHDEETLRSWIDEILNHNQDNLNILDMACGSGNAAAIFIEKNHKVLGFDLSSTMIELAKRKVISPLVKFEVNDLNKFKYDERFDVAVCFMDSLNYIDKITKLEDIFKNVYRHLNKDGKFIFDYHMEERLLEFSEEYIEEGFVLDTPFQWSIVSENNQLLSRFVFYEDLIKTEEHIQYIFKMIEIEEILTKIGFKVKVTNLSNEKYYVEAIK